MGWLRRVVLGRVWRTLTIGLGLMQVVIGHWVTVVLAGREGPGLVLGGALAAALVGANLAVAPTLRRAMRGRGWPRMLARGYVSLGVATLLLGLGVIAAWAGLLPLRAALQWAGVAPETAFQVFRAGSIAVVGTIAALLVWGFTGGQGRIHHSHLRVPLGGLHRDHHGLRVVQISDLHIGNGLEGRRLASLVARVNALEPDLVALTGDIFDFDPAFVDDGARVLAGLGARLGVFAVLGNHDTYTGADRVVDGLARFAPGIRVLRGTVERLAGDPPLYVAGIDDPGHLWTARDTHLPGLDALADRLPGDGPVLLLVHRPEAFPQAARLGFPLVLAGHTHGGQIAVPGFGHRFNLARIITPYHRGLYRENGSVLYVNRGVGVAGPALRISCPREIATIELVCAAVP